MVTTVTVHVVVHGGGIGLFTFLNAHSSHYIHLWMWIYGLTTIVVNSNHRPIIITICNLCVLTTHLDHCRRYKTRE